MVNMQSSEERPTRWFVDLAHFAAWIIASALTCVNGLLARALVTRAIAKIGASMSRDAMVQRQAEGVAFGWTATTINMVMTVLVACACLAFIVGIEYYLRRGAQYGRLLRRVVKVFGAEIIVGALLYGAGFIVS